MSDKPTKKNVLSGKRFFIDPKVDKALSEKVKEKLIVLGGKVEEFLDKGIHFALTSKTVLGTNHKGKQPQCSPLQSPFSTTSPSVEQNVNVVHRWKDLAKQASTKVQLSNIIDVANSFGIKVRLIDDVLAWLNKKTESTTCNNVASTSSNNKKPASQPDEIKLKGPCLKIEDFNRSIKPIYEEFDFFPYLDFSTSGNKCAIVNSRVPKQSGFSKKNAVKKGFCECCQSTYLNDRKHRKTADHVAFGENPSNFEKLDEYILKEKLDMNAFLNRLTDGKEKLDSNETPLKQEKDDATSNQLSSDEVTPTMTAGTVRIKPMKATTTTTVKSRPSVPCRRSPRKLLKSAISDGSISAHLKSGDSLSTTFNPASKKLSIPAAENNLKTITATPVDRSSKNDAAPQNVEISAANLELTNRENSTVPQPVSRDRKANSCVSSIVSLDLTDSPLSRLRSFKRKVEEMKNFSEAPLKRTRLTGKSEFTPSSDIDLLELLQSSVDVPMKSSEFLGF